MMAEHVTLKVEPKRAGGGRARVLERVEREVLAGIARTPTRDGGTVLQLLFENDESCDLRICGEPWIAVAERDAAGWTAGADCPPAGSR
ncbi:hypothetical protein [Burkholderia latens]|uniref:Integrase family protein n=1 Tax=Burkholderia latens TaxID=488446 RepID=A0A6H9T0D1_9BURK|nr:hypothetical protein [Burkholderia latens]KAB0644184.1 hypothetical protein F7R21_04105 [Burkholderia latens]VWB44126.1 integrase family protein [Burkholderia latens]